MVSTLLVFASAIAASPPCQQVPTVPQGVPPCTRTQPLYRAHLCPHPPCPQQSHLCPHFPQLLRKRNLAGIQSEARGTLWHLLSMLSTGCQGDIPVWSLLSSGSTLSTTCSLVPGSTWLQDLDKPQVVHSHPCCRVMLQLCARLCEDFPCHVLTAAHGAGVIVH